MSIKRTVVWVPAEVDEARRAARKAAMGPAVLVPVESGTVIVPTDVRSPIEAERWVARCRRAIGTAEGRAWDAKFTYVDKGDPLSKPDVAQVAEFVDAGAVDRLRQPGLPHYTRSLITIAVWLMVSFLILFGAAALEVAEWVKYGTWAVAAFVVLAGVPRLLLRRQVYPVVELDQLASDSQSAK